MEAEYYYAGLPPWPVLVARTGARWKAPTGPGPEAYPKPERKDLHIVENNPLKEVWEDDLARKAPCPSGLHEGELDRHRRCTDAAERRIAVAINSTVDVLVGRK